MTTSDADSALTAAAAAICGKVEAELAEMSDADAAEFLSSYGLRESGLVRLIRTTYALLGLISFFTAGEDESLSFPFDTTDKGRPRVSPSKAFRIAENPLPLFRHTRPSPASASQGFRAGRAARQQVQS